MLALLLAAALAADSTPSCATDLALLDRKMHENYAGYTLELRGERLRRFAIMKAAMQARGEHDHRRPLLLRTARLHRLVRRSASVHLAEWPRRFGGDCTAGWRGRPSDAERIGCSRLLSPQQRQARSHRRHLVRPWVTRRHRPRFGLGPRRIRGRRPVERHEYVGSGRRSGADHAPRRRDLRRRSVGTQLLAPPSPGWRCLPARAASTLAGNLGKEYPVAAADSGTLDPVDPHRPVLYRRNGTLVFAIPSHDGFRAVIDSMVAAPRDGAEPRRPDDHRPAWQ